MTTDLQVVPDDETPPAGLHIRIAYDVNSAHGSVYDGEELLFSTSYHFVKSCGSWEATREAVLEDAADKLNIRKVYGEPPAAETVEL